MTTVFLRHTDSSPWSRPGDWQSSGHTVELVGCGGDGGGPGTKGTNARGAGNGGGGGGYAKLTYVSGTVGATTPFKIVANNSLTGDNNTNATIWQATTLTNCNYAQAGQRGLVNSTTTATGGQGLAAGGSPVISYSAQNQTGGNGGNSTTGANFAGGGGGGGAAGPASNGAAGGGPITANYGGGGGGSGNAANAGATGSTSGGGNGGNGEGGTGGGAGKATLTGAQTDGVGGAGSQGGGGGGGAPSATTTASQNLTGGAGGTLGNATDWTQTSDSATGGVGGGGGGGGANSGNVTATCVGGAGGNFGGGGGGGGTSRGTSSNTNGGTGGAGLIVIFYSGPSTGTGTLAAQSSTTTTTATSGSTGYSQAKPVLLMHCDGADGSTEFLDATEYPIGIFYTALSGGATGYQGYTTRTVIQLATRGNKSGPYMRITFRSYNDITSGALTDCFVGFAGAGNEYDFDGNQVRVTFNGANGVPSLGVNQLYVSDWFYFPDDLTKKLIVSQFWSGSGVALPNATTSGANYYYHLGNTAGSTLFGSNDGGQTSRSLIELIETRGHRITPVGNAQIDTAQAKFGGASALFDGSGDWLQLDGSSQFALGTGDFTVELFFKFATTSLGVGCFFIDWGGGTSTSPWLIYEHGIGHLRWHTALGNLISVPHTPDTNWHHLAVARAGATTRMFLDGTVIGTDAAVSPETLTVSGGGFPYVGIGNDGATGPMNGWIDELRIIKGTAAWVANFTPPSAPYTTDGGLVTQAATISASGTVANTPRGGVPMVPANLLLHFDGPDASNTFTDSAANHKITANGSAQLDTAKSQFGVASAYFNTSADYLSADSSDFALGLGDFTIECWAYFGYNCSGKSRACVNLGDGSMARIEYRADGKIYVYPDYVKTDAAITLEAWHHIAFTRQAGIARLFLDGIKQSNEYDIGTWNFTTTAITIGPWWTEFSQQACDSWLDEVRIVKGVALYKDDFAVPRAPYVSTGLLLHFDGTDASTTIVDSSIAAPGLLLHFDGADGSTVFLDDANGHQVRPSGNAQIDTAQSKFGGSAALFDGDDHLSLDGSSDFVFGTGDFTIDFWFKAAGLWPLKAFYHAGVYDNTFSYPGIFYRDGYLLYSTDGNANLSGGGSGGTPNSNTLEIAITDDTSWHHVAVTRASGVTRLFFDGTGASWTLTDARDYRIGASNCPRIGRTLGDVFGFIGHIDELRVIKGRALWMANFSPPSAASTPQNNGHTIVCNNAAEIDTAQSKFGGSSLSLPGFGSSITVSQRATDFAFGLDDFTVEFWLRWTGSANAINLFDAGAEAALYDPSTYPIITLVTGQIGNNLYPQDGYWDSGAISADVWHHIAWVRNVGVNTIYVDGVAQATHGIDTHNYSVVSALRIGQVTSVGGLWLDDYRVIKGYAAYGPNFTPPVRQLEAFIGPQAQPSTIVGVGEAAWSGVGGLGTQANLLLHGDGADASTTIVDSSSSPHTVTAVGNAQLDTAKSKFGGASILFDGTGDYLTLDGSSEFAFGTGDFTVDFWAYTQDVSPCFIDFRSAGGQVGWFLIVDGVLRFAVDEVYQISDGSSFVRDVWTHYAVCRASGSTRLFVNGTQVGSTYADSNNYVVGTARPIIGAKGSNLLDNHKGWIDELRIIKGYADWTSNFTPPVAPYRLTGRSTVAGTGSVATTINGNGVLAAQASVVAGAGTSRSTGTGTPAAQAATVSSSGTTRSTGTGTPAAQASTVAGSGTSASTSSSAAVAAQASTVAGAGPKPFWNVTGVLNAQASAVAGSGTTRSTGTGTPAAQSSTVAGSGVSASTSTVGALSAQAAAVSGSGSVGSQPITGTGTAAAQAASVAGAGTSASTGTGTPAAQSATVAGTGVTVSTGTGTLAGQSATVAATGTSRSTGTGVAAAQGATVSGTGTTRSTGTGNPSATAAAVAGSGTVRSTGTGTPAAQSATVAGVANAQFVATGVLAAQAATVAGAGTSSCTGTGVLQAAASTVAGIAQTPGSAILLAQAATVAGVGITSSTGTSAAAAQAATVAGVGASISSGTATLAAQPATVAGTAALVTSGTGVLQAGASTVVGLTGPSTGTGTPSAGAAGIAALGTSSTTATGDLAASGSIVAGVGISGSSGTGTLAASNAALLGRDAQGEGLLHAGASVVVGVGAVLVHGAPADPRPGTGQAQPRSPTGQAQSRSAGAAQPRGASFPANRR